tara:strand:+ start:420 stop:542 length:123 start_codon:yes stop_codon:yes gene_type:complete
MKKRYIPIYINNLEKKEQSSNHVKNKGKHDINQAKEGVFC